MEFEEALQRVGDFGRFQSLTYALLVLPTVHTAIYMMAYVFTARDLPYRCFVPECDSGGPPRLAAPWVSWASPASTVPRPWPGAQHAPDTCLRYVSVGASCSPESFTAQTERCDRWVFPERDKTVVSEFNITCEENRWKLTVVGSLNCMGHLLGMPFSGVLSDRFGRRTLLKAALLLSWLCGTARSLAPNYATYLVFEFLDPFVAAGIYSACFILGVELVAARRRVFGSSLVGSFYSLGCALLGLAAWWQRDWRWLIRVAYVPAALSLPCVWFLPESVRWLLSRDRVDAAQRVLRRVAAVNRAPLSSPLRLRSPAAGAPPTAAPPASPLTKDRAAEAGKDGDTNGLHSAQSDCEVAANTLPAAAALPAHGKPTGAGEWPLVQVCRSRPLMRRLLLTASLWYENYMVKYEKLTVVNSFVYFGLALRSVALAGDIYVNFVLAALVEVPAYVLAWAVSERWGRRACISLTLALTGAALLAFLVLPAGAVALQLALYLTGKLAITASFTVLYVFTAELFPTGVRHSMLGACSTIGRAGAALAPQTPLLEVFFWGLPILLFGLMSLGGALVALLLPETLNEALPDSVAQAEAASRRAAPTERHQTTN